MGRADCSTKVLSSLPLFSQSIWSSIRSYTEDDHMSVMLLCKECFVGLHLGIILGGKLTDHVAIRPRRGEGGCVPSCTELVNY